MARAKTPPEDPAVRAARLAENKKRPPGAKVAKDGQPFSSTGRGPSSVTPIVDFSNWRAMVRTSKVKLTDEQKDVFLTEYAQTARIAASAFAAGVCVQAIHNHAKNDPEFMEAWVNAKQVYADTIRRHAHYVAVEGTDEPLIGGQFKDQIVAYKRTYATNILAMEMRRTDPEYKDRAEVDVNMKGGVLVTPAQLTPQQWADQFAPAEPTTDKPE